MKVLIITKKVCMAASTVVVALIVSVVCIAFSISATQNRLLPIYCVENDARSVALTFDAAWGAEDVDEIISILKRYNAPSAVFVVGEWVEKYPDAVKKLYEAGHEIGNHSDAHKHIDSMSAEDFIADTKRCNERIKAVTGEDVLLYRGPYGEYNNMSVAQAEKLGMYSIQWDCDSRDWKPGFTVDDIVNSALKGIKPGSIMLLHIGAENTTKALPIILERLKSDGYSFVKVSDLIYKENYEIDHTGKQNKKDG